MARLSSRSTYSGPGSRGGQWHIPEFRREYWRRWRAEHPEYREREHERYRQRQLERDRAWVDEIR